MLAHSPHELAYQTFPSMFPLKNGEANSRGTESFKGMNHESMDLQGDGPMGSSLV